MDPISIATTLLPEVIKSSTDIYSDIQKAADPTAFRQDVPFLDANLNGGFDPSVYTNMDYSAGTTFGKEIAGNPLAALNPTGITVAAINHLKSKKQERQFEQDKANAIRQGLYMNGVADYRNYQRRGLASSAQSQIENYVRGMSNV